MLAALCAGFVTAADAEELANTRCPVKPDEEALSRFSAVHDGKTVHFCCERCVEKFVADPARYLAALPQFADAGRSPFQRRVDWLWNAAARIPGIVIGGLALAGLLSARGIFALARVRSGPRRWVDRALSRRGLAVLLGLTLAGEAVAAHVRAVAAEIALNDRALDHYIHFATFTDFGDPPVPPPPAHSPRMEVIYYRGNDERSELLFNGGFYRTAEFAIAVCGADGAPLHHGDPLPSADAMFLKVVVTRAPGTPDYFWSAERMAKMFATRECGHFLGRDGPVADAVELRTLDSRQRWELLFPLAGFPDATGGDPFGGIVYLCERRFNDAGKRIGARFHYGFQFALHDADGLIGPDSGVWMGALYRSSVLRAWEIPPDEWLSATPIPVIEGGHATSDPALLGITEHEQDPE